VRKQLNENPAVQAGLILVLVIVFAFILFTRVLGGEEAPPAAAEPVPGATTSAATPSATGELPPGATPAPTGATAPPTGATSPAPIAGAGFEAGPGLPGPVVEAYEGGKTVVFLVIREHPQGCFSKAPLGESKCAGIDDRRLAAIVRVLELRPTIEVFITHAFGLARYSRIAQGVDVERLPALIVLQPKRLADGQLPVATINYGFRGPASVVQTVKDAEYKGRQDIPYYPE
jgi:hypothetical protein